VINGVSRSSVGYGYGYGYGQGSGYGEGDAKRPNGRPDHAQDAGPGYHGKRAGLTIAAENPSANGLACSPDPHDRNH
jgi:hypothetical protein